MWRRFVSTVPGSVCDDAVASSVDGAFLCSARFTGVCRSAERQNCGPQPIVSDRSPQLGSVKFGLPSQRRCLVQRFSLRGLPRVVAMLCACWKEQLFRHEEAYVGPTQPQPLGALPPLAWPKAHEESSPQPPSAAPKTSRRVANRYIRCDAPSLCDVVVGSWRRCALLVREVCVVASARPGREAVMGAGVRMCARAVVVAYTLGGRGVGAGGRDASLKAVPFLLLGWLRNC